MYSLLDNFKQYTGKTFSSDLLNYASKKFKKLTDCLQLPEKRY